MIRDYRRRGSAILEFAIGSGVLLAVFTGTFHFGYSFYTFTKLESAVRSGARFGSLTAYDRGVPTVNSSPTSAFLTAVQNVTVYGYPVPPPGNVPVAPGLRPQDVRVNVTYSGGTPLYVTVSIAGYQVRNLFANWTLNNKPAATFLYVGRYNPPPA